MAFNNVPVNGWPQIKDLDQISGMLADLNELAEKIDTMPTYTSEDRAWLDEWEEKLPELPEDPQTDGIKVLTATTSEGETVKSWEEPASGGVDYSTTETDTGIKWIDNKRVYRLVKQYESSISVQNSAWTAASVNITGINTLISAYGVFSDACYPLMVSYDQDGNIKLLACRDGAGVDIDYLILEYTKTTT